MILSVTEDVFSLLSLHIYCFYFAAARLYSWQLNVLSSLWRLFRGKKKNVLRHRIDSADYDLNQLLVGTVLFSVFFFLYPTTTVYYAFFVFARFLVVFIQSTLAIIATVLNHLPIFSLFLRYFDPKYFPAGVSIQVYHLNIAQTHNQKNNFYQTNGHHTNGIIIDPPNHHSNSNEPYNKLAHFSVPFTDIASPPSSQRNKLATTYFNLKGVPLAIGGLFFDYSKLIKRITKLYTVSILLKCLLFGEPIQIPRNK